MSTPQIELNTGLVLDERGRIVSTREPYPARGPLFTLLRSATQCAWAVRDDVPPDVAEEIDALAREEPPIRDLRLAPLRADRYVALSGGQLGFSGPAFTFPAQPGQWFPEARQNSVSRVGAARGAGRQRARPRLSEGDKRTVLLQDSGDVPANVQLRIPGNTVFNACGTINVVAPTGGSDRSPCYARGASNIDIPHITITGAAQYGCFFRDVDNVRVGVADIRLGGGLGMRFDNNPAANNLANSTSNAARRSGFQLDDVYVEGASHGVELYGVEDITIGRVVARNLSQAGLMLNNSRNIEVGLVDGQGVSPMLGTPYSAWRTTTARTGTLLSDEQRRGHDR